MERSVSKAFPTICSCLRPFKRKYTPHPGCAAIVESRWSSTFASHRAYLMNISLALLASAIGATLFFTVGCTRNRQYRTSFAPCDGGQAGADCTNAVIETTADYK